LKVLIAPDPAKRGETFWGFLESIDDAEGDGGRLIEGGAGEKEKIDPLFRDSFGLSSGIVGDPPPSFRAKIDQFSTHQKSLTEGGDFKKLKSFEMDFLSLTDLWLE
jgi:hypothetical protein